jgi:hypothetical protein
VCIHPTRPTLLDPPRPTSADYARTCTLCTHYPVSHSNLGEGPRPPRFLPPASGPRATPSKPSAVPTTTTTTEHQLIQQKQPQQQQQRLPRTARYTTRVRARAREREERRGARVTRRRDATTRSDASRGSGRTEPLALPSPARSTRRTRDVHGEGAGPRARERERDRERERSGRYHRRHAADADADADADATTAATITASASASAAAAAAATADTADTADDDDDPDNDDDDDDDYTSVRSGSSGGMRALFIMRSRSSRDSPTPSPAFPIFLRPPPRRRRSAQGREPLIYRIADPRPHIGSSRAFHPSHARARARTHTHTFLSLVMPSLNFLTRFPAPSLLVFNNLASPFGPTCAFPPTRPGTHCHPSVINFAINSMASIFYPLYCKRTINCLLSRSAVTNVTHSVLYTRAQTLPILRN